MANDIVEGLKNTVRYLPQNVIQGILGQNIGHKVESWLGMPLGPDANAGLMGGGDVYQPAGSPDPNYHSDMLNRANESFRQRALQQQAPAAPQPPRRGFPQR